MVQSKHQIAATQNSDAAVAMAWPVQRRIFTPHASFSIRAWASPRDERVSLPGGLRGGQDCYRAACWDPHNLICGQKYHAPKAAAITSHPAPLDCATAGAAITTGAATGGFWAAASAARPSVSSVGIGAGARVPDNVGKCSSSRDN